MNKGPPLKKQAEQLDSKEYRAWTPMWNRPHQYHKHICLMAKSRR